MSMTITLPAATEAALRAEADLQGRPADDIIAEALVQFWESADTPDSAYENVLESPGALADIQTALEEAEDDHRTGRLLTVEEMFQSVQASIQRRQQELDQERVQKRVAGVVE